jgi:hypothetical protein
MNASSLRRHLGVALIVGLLAAHATHSAGQSKASLKTEHFDRDPEWEGHRNHIVPKAYPKVTQEFGYSRTNFAGKGVGEIGGQVQRASEPAYYGAKTSKTLDDPLSASGTFAITQIGGNSGVFFGWFNSHQPGATSRPVTSFGMSIDGEGGGARLAVYMITGQNRVAGRFITRYERYRSDEERAIKRPTPIRKDGTRYHWKLDYDPDGNDGHGRFQFYIKSDRDAQEEFEGKVFTVDLPKDFKQQGTTFGRFGMLNLLRDGSALTIHFDDLEIDGRKEDFAQDPGWEGSRNHESYEATEIVGVQNFGLQPSQHAGGSAGELGGVIWRAPYAYYADRTTKLSLEDRLEARGRMFFASGGVDADVRIGWFNSEVKDVDDKAPHSGGNFAGVQIGGNTRIGHAFQPACLTSKGERIFADGGPLLKAGQAYDWSFVYDPSANGGSGQMRVTLGGESVTLDLTASIRAQGATLDRFGITSVGTGGGLVKLYLDDLQYTASGR